METAPVTKEKSTATCSSAERRASDRLLGFHLLPIALSHGLYLHSHCALRTADNRQMLPMQENHTHWKTRTTIIYPTPGHKYIINSFVTAIYSLVLPACLCLVRDVQQLLPPSLCTLHPCMHHPSAEKCVIIFS